MLPGCCQTETDLDWLRNHVKVVGERKILVSIVEFKQYWMAETIQKEHEEKTTKVKAPVMMKQDKKTPNFKQRYLRKRDSTQREALATQKIEN